ncbi:MAG: L,D-transpeptidase [Hyphomicrobiaceae bacterium]
MYRTVLSVAVLLAATVPASAQSWVPWHQPDLLERYKPEREDTPKAAPSARKKQRKGNRSTSAAPAGLTGGFWFFDQDDDDDEDAPARNLAPAKPKGPVVVEGGPRPELSPRPPQTVSYQSSQPPGTIVIDTAARQLYLIRSNDSAYVYPVSVGKEGFTWAGEEKISRVASWPDWHPPAEMRERNPKLPNKMTGGLWNPLGAKALYLGNSLYRIHGTSDAQSIGRAASSGCFRMHNRHVIDLAQRVGVGTKVVVINASVKKTASAAR